ncbi:MAG: DNA repair protein RadC [Clostridiaceae bacterium]|nr:DNA repair protein RadC [Clostridiaceae bacterium]
MSVHDGHRERMTARFLKEGLDGFSPHNILELLLFFGVPRKDTNELAHILLDTFGSLSGVLDAPVAELTDVGGIGEHTAALLHLMPQLARAYLSDREREVCINSTEKAGKYLLPRFVGRDEETVFMICVDGKCRVLSTTLLHRGNINSAEVSIRGIVATALRHNAAGVILAHNHPGGVALPSPEDLSTTCRICDALVPVGVRLIDHIIVADGDFVSLADSGYVIK